MMLFMLLIATHHVMFAIFCGNKSASLNVQSERKVLLLFGIGHDGNLSFFSTFSYLCMQMT